MAGVRTLGVDSNKCISHCDVCV